MYLVIDGDWLGYSRFCVQNLFAGFIYELYQLETFHNPIGTNIVWDNKDGPSWRKILYPEYKSKRKKDPRYFEMRPELQQAISWLGIDQYIGQGEADDVIATMVRRPFTGPHLIFSADKDFLQLVDHDVAVHRAKHRSRSDQLVTENNIVQLTGLNPKGWLDFLSLAGDTSDGIPGVPGVGKTYAKRILASYPNIIEHVLNGKNIDANANADKIDAKIIALIMNNLNLLATSRKLAQMRNVEYTRHVAQEDWGKLNQWIEERDLKQLKGLFYV